MVAAEAAAAGCPPLVARHSGLAEIAAGLEEGYPPEQRDLAAFATGDAAELAAKLRRASSRCRPPSAPSLAAAGAGPSTPLELAAGSLETLAV